MMRRHLIFGAALGAAALFLALSAVEWGGISRAHAAMISDSSAAGLAQGRGSHIFLDNDAYYWIGYAQEMAAKGVWRIRATQFDDPPDGRPVHWSQSVSWLLLGLGAVRHFFSGEGMASAIESAAIWSEPLLLWLWLLLAGVLLLKRLGLGAALVWVVMLCALPPIQWTFHPLRPDHHGLQVAFSLSSLLCLVLGGLGWVAKDGAGEAGGGGWFKPLTPPSRVGARRGFLAAGVLGGLGLWVGATVQLMGIGLFALAALVVLWLMPSDEEGAPFVYDPRLWRVWGISGASVALFFYGLEYMPSFPGMRLEVNHPVYAVSWFCVGEVLARISAARTQARRLKVLPVAAFALGAVLTLLLLLLGPSDWHALRDPWMQRLHQFIDEFRPFGSASGGRSIAAWFQATGIFLAALAVGARLVGSKRTTLYEWACLLATFFVALVYGALTYMQARWLNFFVGAALLFVVVAMSVLARLAAGQRRWRVGLVALVVGLAAQALYFLAQEPLALLRGQLAKQPLAQFVPSVLQAQLARNLRAENPMGALRAMASPNLAARLQYFGGIPSVCSYYWENRDGLRDATLFFSSTNDEAARAILRERGITQVIVSPSPEIAQMFFYIEAGYPFDGRAGVPLGFRLLGNERDFPRWLRRDVAREERLQPGVMFAGQRIVGTVRVFDVVGP